MSFCYFCHKGRLFDKTNLWIWHVYPYMYIPEMKFLVLKMLYYHYILKMKWDVIAHFFPFCPQIKCLFYWTGNPVFEGFVSCRTRSSWFSGPRWSYREWKANLAICHPENNKCYKWLLAKVLVPNGLLREWWHKEKLLVFICTTN